MNSRIYRCGNCGNATNENGAVLEQEAFKKAMNIIEKYHGKRTYLVYGDCCINQLSGQEPRYVTRDMAIDAGDLSLEGQKY